MVITPPELSLRPLFSPGEGVRFHLPLGPMAHHHASAHQENHTGRRGRPALSCRPQPSAPHLQNSAWMGSGGGEGLGMKGLDSNGKWFYSLAPHPPLPATTLFSSNSGPEIAPWLGREVKAETGSPLFFLATHPFPGLRAPCLLGWLLCCPDGI